MTFSDFIAERLGTRRWVLARKTPRLAVRYDAFLSQSRYDDLARDYLANGGNPLEVNPRIAAGCGFVLAKAA